MPKRRLGTRLSAAKVRELLATEPAPPEHIESAYAPEARLLSDGRVLLVYEDRAGVVYPSRAELDAMMRSVEALAAAGPVDPKKTLLPPADEFLAHVTEHAARLGQELGAPGPFDGSEESLAQVDAALARLRPAARSTPSLVTSLTAYAGEYLRRVVAGSWRTLPSNDGMEPVVVADDGRVIQPFALVYLELERGKRGSLRGALSGALLGRRPKS